MQHFGRRILIAGVSLIAWGLGSAGGQDAPSITDTPEALVVEWRSPELHVPEGPRINQTSPRTVQLLGEALQRNTTLAGRRAELVGDLGKTQLAEAIPFIEAALSDPDPLVRGAAAQAAGRLGRSELAEPVARLIGDSEPVVRAQATVAHATLTAGREKPSPVVLEALNDASDSVRIAALLNASTEAEADAIAAALPSLRPRLQFHAIEAIARIGSTDNADAVAARLEADPGQQVAAARALAALKATRHAEGVSKLLASPHPAVRRAAVESLPGVMDAAEARAAAERLLDDADPSVRAAAAAHVAPVQSPDVARRLLELLADPYLPVHDAALTSLADVANDSVRQTVISAAVSLLDSPQPRRRQDGSYLLGAYRSNAGLDKQLAILQTKLPTDSIDEQVMIETVSALGRIGDERAKDGVFALAERGVKMVTNLQASGDLLAAAATTEAIVAAARLGDKRVLEPARRVITGNPEFVPADPRAASAWAFGQAGDPGDRAAGGPLNRLYNSEFDSDETKFEAIKAMGRLKLEGNRATMSAAAREGASPRLRWIGSWALMRTTGNPEPYTPPEMPWRAAVSIEDTSAR